MFWNFQALRKICRPLFFLLLLFPGVLAGPQEPDVSGEAEEMGLEAPAFVETGPEEPLPEPRWFRSNAAGMTLEELASRLAALRNEYALGIDFIPPGELPAILASRYEESWQVEVHILYKQGHESRRQWIFRDLEGTARLVAVFNQDLLNPPELEIKPVAEPEEPAAEPEEAGGETVNPEADETGEAEGEGEPADGEAGTEGEPAALEAEGGDETENGGGSGPVLTGFIETYNQDGQITGEHLFY
jgi:hypothetical protein